MLERVWARTLSKMPDKKKEKEGDAGIGAGKVKEAEVTSAPAAAAPINEKSQSPG